MTKDEFLEKLKAAKQANDNDLIHVLLVGLCNGRVTDNWQPIETVPKNKVVLMFDDSLDVVTINMAHEDGSTLKMPLDCYSHWMPLPEPPEVAK